MATLFYLILIERRKQIKDLNSRLLNTRLPDQGPGEPWKTGTDLEWFKKLLEFWNEIPPFFISSAETKVGRDEVWNFIKGTLPK